MANSSLLLFAVCLAVWLVEIEGHGRMVVPPNRSSLWRDSRFRKARTNNEDNQNYCGGLSVQNSNGGKCGPCGDNYRDKIPRRNENGGLYGRGKIVEKYRAGDKIKVVIDISANHLGHFEFHLCELQHKRDVETEECFAERPLSVVNENGKLSKTFSLGRKRGMIPVVVELPQDFKCKRCVLRWHYTAGNNWGICPNGKGRQGCGPQETFRSCSDIAIY